MHAARDPANTVGKRVGGNPSRVRISYPPPVPHRARCRRAPLFAAGPFVVAFKPRCPSLATIDEDRILAHLESAREIYTAMGAQRDALASDEWIAGSESLVTDGTWIWPVDLVHYVRRPKQMVSQAASASGGGEPAKDVTRRATPTTSMGNTGPSRCHTVAP